MSVCVNPIITLVSGGIKCNTTLANEKPKITASIVCSVGIATHEVFMVNDGEFTLSDGRILKVLC
jgi:hypothetical protein